MSAAVSLAVHALAISSIDDAAIILARELTAGIERGHDLAAVLRGHFERGREKLRENRKPRYFDRALRHFRERTAARSRPVPACEECRVMLGAHEIGPFCVRCIEPKGTPVDHTNRASRFTVAEILEDFALPRPVYEGPCEGCPVCKGRATDGYLVFDRRLGCVVEKFSRPSRANPEKAIERVRRTLATEERAEALAMLKAQPRLATYDADEWLAEAWSELENPSELVAGRERDVSLATKVRKAVNRAQHNLRQQNEPTGLPENYIAGEGFDSSLPSKAVA